MTPEVNSIYPGDCISVMASWPANFVDTIITDPPYGLSSQEKRSMRRASPSETQREKFKGSGGFMGMLWDSVVPGPEYWAEMLRVCKPGAMLLAFGGTRTYHRLAVAIEDAGWEIRDCLMWLYGSGFPKSLDISKAIDKAKGAEREIGRRKFHARDGDVSHQPSSLHVPDNDVYGAATTPRVGFESIPSTDLARAWSGWGTALKPAWEPIIVAMKPLDGTFAHNAETWGVAGLNVDGGRIGYTSDADKQTVSDGCDRMRNSKRGDPGQGYSEDSGWQRPWRSDSEKAKEKAGVFEKQGRWPANLILDEEAAAMLDGASEGKIHGAGSQSDGKPMSCQDFGIGGVANRVRLNSVRVGDSGGASRFFYVAKSSRAERNEGCEGMEEKPKPTLGEYPNDPTKSGATPRANHHPTVKPLSLMKYLCLLTKTPTGGIVLDPFAGSGTTLWAAEFHNRPWLGIEMNPEYVAIANARIARERAQMKMAI